MASRGSRKTTFDKLQRERARQEKQALKRARRQGKAEHPPTTPLGGAADWPSEPAADEGAQPDAAEPKSHAEESSNS